MRELTRLIHAPIAYCCPVKKSELVCLYVMPAKIEYANQIKMLSIHEQSSFYIKVLSYFLANVIT
jgi:hypothetical protein